MFLDEKINFYNHPKFIKTETKQVEDSMKTLIEATDMTFENAIKSSIFISDMNNFSQFNDIYGQYFYKTIAPARETVEVANLPKFVNVEISMIALK